MVQVCWLHWVLLVEYVALHIKCTSGAGVLLALLEFTSILTWLFLFITITALRSVNHSHCRRHQFLQEITRWTDIHLHVPALFASACPPLPILWHTSGHNRLSAGRSRVTGCVCPFACQFVGELVIDIWWFRRIATENNQNRRTAISETSGPRMQLLIKLLSTYLDNR